MDRQAKELKELCRIARHNSPHGATGTMLRRFDETDCNLQWPQEMSEVFIKWLIERLDREQIFNEAERDDIAASLRRAMHRVSACCD